MSEYVTSQSRKDIDENKQCKKMSVPSLHHYCEYRQLTIQNSRLVIDSFLDTFYATDGLLMWGAEE